MGGICWMSDESTVPWKHLMEEVLSVVPGGHGPQLNSRAVWAGRRRWQRCLQALDERLARVVVTGPHLDRDGHVTHASERTCPPIHLATA